MDPRLTVGKNGSLHITRSYYEELQRNIFIAEQVNLKSHGSTNGFAPLIESFDSEVSPAITQLPQQVVNHYDQDERILKGTSKSRSRAAMFASIAIGVGMNLLLPGSGALWAMGNAAISTCASQAGSGLIMNKGDFGTTFKGMVTPDSLRQLGVSIATAGALNKLGLPTQPQGFTEHFQVNFARSFVSSGLTAATGGCTIEEALKQVGIGTGVGTLGGLGAGYIGDLGDLGVNPIIPEFLHIGLGAGIGAAMSDDHRAGAIAGAVGAGVSHLFAHLITPRCCRHEILAHKAMQRI